MTLKELESEVLALSFEEEPEDDAALVAVINRALATIHTERDRIEELTLFQPKNEPVFFAEHLHHEGGTELEKRIAGRAFSLSATGQGELIIRDGDGERRRAFSGNLTAVRELVHPEGATLIFGGDYDYDVYGLAVFARLYSPRAADVELFGEAREYDMTDFDPHFIAFAAPPLTSCGDAIPAAVAEGKLLKLPRSFSGAVRVKYKRGFSPLKGDRTQSVDVARECEHLIAPLAAAYLLLDGDEKLAEYYVSLYRDGMAAVKLYNRRTTSGEYRDVLGWA